MSSPREKKFKLFSYSPSTSTTSNTNKIKKLINDDWINSLKNIIEKKTSKSKYFWQDYHYSPEDLTDGQVNNLKKDEAYYRHNPLGLRLPYVLESFETFYNYKMIHELSYTCDTKISRSDAILTYYLFLKQYNLAYIALLNTLNYPEEIESLKSLFTSNIMFQRSDIEIKFLNEKVAKPAFLLALLAYLTLEIMFSNNDLLTTAARLETLKIINKHFDVKKIATAFSSFSSGYYTYGGDEKLYHLIPKSFLPSNDPMNNYVHNHFFLKNPIIEDIFEISFSYSGNKMNLDDGILKLIDQYPTEMMQILHGLLKYNYEDMTIDRETILLVIFRLIKLDKATLELILSPKASFRNHDEIVENEKNNDNIFEHDDLDYLSKNELKTLFREAVDKIKLLEEKLAIVVQKNEPIESAKEPLKVYEKKI